MLLGWTMFHAHGAMIIAPPKVSEFSLNVWIINEKPCLLEEPTNYIWYVPRSRDRPTWLNNVMSSSVVVRNELVVCMCVVCVHYYASAICLVWLARLQSIVFYSCVYIISEHVIWCIRYVDVKWSFFVFFNFYWVGFYVQGHVSH